MLGNNLDEVKNQNNNVKVTKTIKKVLNKDSENPEIVEEIVYYDKDKVEKFNNFENGDFSIDEKANNIRKDVTVEEDENGTVTKVVNIEYSILEDDINNEGDIIIESSIINDINDGTEHIEQGEKSFITNMDSVIMDGTGGISFIESKVKLDKIEESTTNIETDNLSLNPTEEIIEIDQPQVVEEKIETPINDEYISAPEEENATIFNNIKVNDLKNESKENIIDVETVDGTEPKIETLEKSVEEATNDGEISTTKEVVIDPETGKKKTITKKVTRKVITKNIGEDLSEIKDGESFTTEIVVDPITGKKKYVTKRVIRKLINKSGPKEEVSEEPTITTRELPGGVTETTELVVDPVTGKKKYVTKRVIRKIVTANIVENAEPEIVKQESIEDPASKIKEEIVEVPSKVQNKKKYIKRIIRYIKRINPATGEEEIVEEPFEESISESREGVVPDVKEEIVEVPSEESGKKKYIKRIIRYIKRINPSTGEEEIVEEQPIEEIISKPKEDIVPEVKEEVVEVPSDKPGKKKYIKRIIRYVKRINPTTGEEEVVEEQPVEEIVSEEEQKKPGFFDKLTNKIEEIIVGDEKPNEKEIVKEDVVEEEPVVLETVSTEPKEVVTKEQQTKVPCAIENVSAEVVEQPTEEIIAVVNKSIVPENVEELEKKKNVKYRVFGKKSRRSRNKKNKNGNDDSEIFSEDSRSEIKHNNAEDLEQQKIENVNEPVSELRKEVIEPIEMKEEVKPVNEFITEDISQSYGEIAIEPKNEKVQEDVEKSEKKNVMYRVFGKGKKRSKKPKNGVFVDEELPENEESFISEDIEESKLITEKNDLAEPKEEVISEEQPVEQSVEEPVEKVKEQIVEVPSDEPGVKKYIKRIIRYVKRINPTTGKEEIVEEQPVEEVISEPKEDIVPEVKEEIVEVPSEEPGKKKYIKRIIRYIKRINPTTGEEEVVEEKPVEEVVSEEEQKKPGFFDKLANKIEEIIVGDEKPNEKEIVKEDVVEEEQVVLENVSTEPKEENVPLTQPIEESINKKENKYFKLIPTVISMIVSEAIRKDDDDKQININKLMKEFNEIEIAEEKPVVLETVSAEPKEEIVTKEKPVEEPIEKQLAEEQLIEEQSVEEVGKEPKEEAVPEVEEEIVEVPKDEPGKKKFKRRIIRYSKRINSVDEKEEVVEEKPVDKESDPERKEIVEVVRDPETDEIMYITRRVVTEIITLVEDEESDGERNEIKKEKKMVQNENRNGNDVSNKSFVTKAVVTELLVDVESESENEIDEEQNIKEQSNFGTNNGKEITKEQFISDNSEVKQKKTKKSKDIMRKIRKSLKKSKKSRKDEDIITTSIATTEVNKNKEDLEIPLENGNTRYIKRIIRYRINPETGEREIVDEPIEQVTEEPITIVNEFINEVPSEVQGVKKYVKRIIKKLVKINMNGEREIIDEEPIEIPIESFDQPIRTRKEELIESDSETGNKKIVKKVITYLTIIDPITGEREDIIEGQHIQSAGNNVTTINKDAGNNPLEEEQGRAKYIKRIVKYKINPETGEKEIVDEPVEHISEEPMCAIREEIVEIPSKVPGKKKFVKRINRYLTRVNPKNGENEVIEDKAVDEPINEFNEPVHVINEEIVEVPSKEEGKKRFIKKIVRRYIKINPITGEMEIVKGPTENSVVSEENRYVQLIPSVISMIVTESIRKDEKDKQNNIDKLMNEFKKIERTYTVKEIESEPITIVNEFINEVPSVKGVKKYVKRIIRKIINISANGQREVINEEPIEIPIENFEQPIRTKKEELIDVSKDKSGKRKVIKKVITYLTTIDPITGERKVNVEGTKILDSVVDNIEEQDNENYIKRIVRYKINPITGEKEVINDKSYEQLYEESVVTIVEDLVEIPTFEAGQKRFVKKIYRYITKINTITGEKKIIEEQPFEESVEQSSDKPIVIVREEIVEVPSQGTSRKSFIKRIIRYLVKINSAGEKEIIGEQHFDEPIINVREETVEIPTEEENNRYSKRITRYRINPITGEKELIDEREINDDGKQYEDDGDDEGKSIIGKLQKLSKHEERTMTIDDSLEENSYNGKEIIDQIKNALVFEDRETKEVSDMDIHVDPFVGYSYYEDPLKENKKNLVIKNYKEYEEFVDNEKDVVNEEEEKQHLRRKSDQIVEVERTDAQSKPEFNANVSEKQMKEEVIEDPNCCAVKSSYFTKKNEDEVIKTKEIETVNDYRRIKNSKRDTVEEKEAYDLNSVTAPKEFSYFDNISTSSLPHKTRKNKNKDCIIM